MSDSLPESFPFIVSPEMVDRIGRAIVDVLWKFSLLAVAAFLVGHWMRRRAALTRFLTFARVLGVLIFGILSAVTLEAAAATDDTEPGFGPESHGLRCRLVALAPDVNDDAPDMRQVVNTSMHPADMTFAVELKNVSSTSQSLAGVRYGDGDAENVQGKLRTEMLAPHWFEFEFADMEGNPIPRTQREFFETWLASHDASVHEVKPGQSLVVVLRPAKFNVPMDYDLPAGRYSVQVRYRGPDEMFRAKVREHFPDKPILNSWSHQVVSNSVEFAVEQPSRRLEPDDLVWGEEVDGLKAAIEYRLDEGVEGDPLTEPGVPVGTNIGVVFHVRNVADRPITFVSETGRQGDQILVTNEQGEKVEVNETWFSGWPIDVAWKLQPGETAELHVLAPAINKIDQPGSYSVRYTIRFNSRVQKDEAGNVTFPRPGDYDSELNTGETPLFLRAEGDDVESQQEAKQLRANETTTANDVDDDTTKQTPSSLAIRGQAFDASDQPVAGAIVEAKTLEGQEIQTIADGDGRFDFEVPSETVRVALTVRDPSDSMMWTKNLYPKSVRSGNRPGIDEPLTAELSPQIGLPVSVVDQDANPVAGATVAVQNGLTEIAVLTTDESGTVVVRLPETSQPMIMAFKSGVGYDYFSADVRDENNYPVNNPPKLGEQLRLTLDGARTVRVKAVDTQGQLISGVTISPWYVNKEGNPGNTNFGATIFSRVTNNDGIAIFDWLPPNMNWGVTFWVRSPEFDADRLTVEVGDLDETRDYEVKLKRLTELRGRVVDTDGRPVAGAVVQASGQGASADPSNERATTDASGRFTMSVPPDKAYVVHVARNELVGYVGPVVIRENRSPDDLEIKLAKATVVRGKVTRGTPPKPVAQQWVSLRLELGRIPDEIQGLAEEGDRRYYSVNHHDGIMTDSAGSFRFLAGPGKYVLFGPQQAKSHQFTLAGETEVEVDFHVPRQEMMQLAGIVRGPDGKPVANASIDGVYQGWTHSRHSLSGRTNAVGRFEIERETQPATVHVQSADKSLAAIVEIDGDSESLNVDLTPTFDARGILLSETGSPMANAKIKYGVKVYQGENGTGPWTESFGGSVMTDDEGNYSLEHLAQDTPYNVTLERSEEGPWSTITTIHNDAATLMEIGETRMSTTFGPTPLPKRVAAAFASDQPLAERLTTLKREADRDYLRIAIIVASPDSQEGEWFYQLLRGTSDDGSHVTDEDMLRRIRSGMNDFRQLWVNDSQLQELRELLPSIEITDATRSALILLESDGSSLEFFSPELASEPKRSVADLEAAIQSQQLPDKHAAEVLKAAREQAAREGKRIFLQETASWCGPCHMLSRFIEQHRDIFDRHFVWVKIDRDRMTDGDTVMKPIRLGRSRSIPWIAVLDEGGNVLGTSTSMPEELRAALLGVHAELAIAQGNLGENHPTVVTLQQNLDSLYDQLEDDNFGFPTAAKEIDRFLNMVKAAVPTLTAEEVEVLRTGLRGKQESAASNDSK